MTQFVDKNKNDALKGIKEGEKGVTGSECHSTPGPVGRGERRFGPFGGLKPARSDSVPPLVRWIQNTKMPFAFHRPVKPPPHSSSSGGRRIDCMLGAAGRALQRTDSSPDDAAQMQKPPRERDNR